MKVRKITVQNLKAIKDKSIDFNGCTAIITGGNNKGKTSFLKSLPERIRGNKPDIIVKEGEEDGFAEWELTDGSKFIWEFDTTTKKGEKLKFITSDNIKTSVTREIAQRYFPPIFDIDKFLHATPKKQIQIIQDLTGVDLDKIEEEYKKAYEERTVLNRIAKQKESSVVEADENWATELQDTSELEEELKSIDLYNQNLDFVKKGVEERKQDLKAIEEKIAKLKAEIKKGEDYLENNPRKENKEELETQINTIQEKNKTYYLRKEADKSFKEYRETLKEAQAQDQLVKDLEDKKKKALSEAKLPDGFEIVDGQITFNGFPLTKEQLSSSGIYIAALKLASLQVGEVRTLHFDASYLDKDSLKDIEKWATENDLQLLIERPDFDGGEIEYQLLQDV